MEENSKIYFELYEQIAELKSIKRLIKDNVSADEKGELKASIFFAEDLLKLIKYIDIEFYNELLQQG